MHEKLSLVVFPGHGILAATTKQNYMQHKNSEHSFSQRVWELATSIPVGRVTTYGTIAKAAGGGAMAARSISSILSKAPNQKAIPWHRIVYANGRVWLDSEHEVARRKLYKKERITVDEKGYIISFDEVFYDFHNY
jgi:methylated-DNA-protein-cysteine methyltransferase related protein